MKVKTSITLSSEILVKLGQLTSDGNRSEFIERAVWTYLDQLYKEERNKRDLEILNNESLHLNIEAIDTLSYQELQ
jgi:hypothetical protein